MDHKTRNASNLTDITGMFDADTIELIRAGYAVDLEKILDDMMYEAFVHPGDVIGDVEQKWTYAERIAIAELTTNLKNIARLLCTASVKDGKIMLIEADANKMDCAMLDVGREQKGKYQSLSYLEQLLINQLVIAPAALQTNHTKEHIDTVLYGYGILKRIIISYNMHWVTRSMAA